jgi:hypothetical protein
MQISRLKAAARKRRYYWRHREWIKAKRAVYYQKHREECIARVLRYRRETCLAE